MSATLSYVFCLVRSARQPALRGVKTGVPGGSDLRAVHVGDRLWAIVQCVPESDYGEAAIAAGLRDLDWVGTRALAHEQVIERFLSAPALLPMQLFTLFKSDDRVVEYVRTDRRRIARVLERVTGNVEWGVRLIWDERTARTEVEQKYARPTTGPGRTAARPPRGTDYLARKRDILDVNRAQLAAARAEADRVYRTMSSLATDAVRRTITERAAPGSRLLLDAAFLVRSTRTPSFRAALRKQTRGLRTVGIAVALTGPWPPYNFIAS